MEGGKDTPHSRSLGREVARRESIDQSVSLCRSILMGIGVVAAHDGTSDSGQSYSCSNLIGANRVGKGRRLPLLAVECRRIGCTSGEEVCGLDTPNALPVRRRLPIPDEVGEEAIARQGESTETFGSSNILDLDPFISSSSSCSSSSSSISCACSSFMCILLSPEEIPSVGSLSESGHSLCTRETPSLCSDSSLSISCFASIKLSGLALLRDFDSTEREGTGEQVSI